MSQPDLTTTFEEHRRRLVGIAYRMLGSVAEAEDVVQDAYLRWTSADRDDVREPAAYLTTITTRLCLDRLRSARYQRETYVGPWLPEPMATDDLDPADLAAAADSLSFAFLVLLESLSPLERVVLVLHDVFGHPHAEIAAMLGRSHAAVRTVATRARRHIDEGHVRYEPDREQEQAVAASFLEVCEGGDLDAMLAMMAPGIEFVSDGGGVVSAVPYAMTDPLAIARMLRGFWRTGRRDGVRVDLIEANAAPAIRIRSGRDTVAVMVIELTDGLISAIRAIRNPAKLQRFDGPAD